MTATPQYGTFQFVGVLSRKTYTKDVYVSDVANATVKFDGGTGASSTSPGYWRTPEPVVLRDYSQVTGTADTTKIQLVRNGVQTGDVLRYAIHLTTLNNRPGLNIPFMKGDEISAIQLA